MQVLAGLAMLGQDLDLEGAAAAESKRPPRMSVNGCIILQALLAMPQSVCKRISDELVSLPPGTLGFIASDASGAHVLEAFVKVCPLRSCALFMSNYKLLLFCLL
jgi:hypothetical protein